MGGSEEFVRQFRGIQPKFSRFYARLLAEAGLSLPQFALLSQLLARGAVSMTEVSAKLHISKPAVTNLVDRLEKKKYLKRLPRPGDRRVSLLKILPLGKKPVRKTQGEVLSFILKTLREFDRGEQAVITRFYTCLSRTLDATLGKEKR